MKKVKFKKGDKVKIISCTLFGKKKKASWYSEYIGKTTKVISITFYENGEIDRLETQLTKNYDVNPIDLKLIKEIK